MGSVAVYGGYQPWTAGQDFPPGPAQWPAGATWPLRASKRVYANDLNQQLSLPVAFLARKPVIKGSQQVTSQAVSANTQTPINIDTEINDAWYMHSQPGDGSLAITPFSCDGIWLVQGTVPYASAPAGNYVYQANIMKNGVVVANGQRLGSTGVHVGPYVADLISAASADQFRLVGWHTYTPGTVNTYITTGASGGVQYFNNAYPQLTMRWVAANNTLHGGVLNGVTLGIPNPGTWTTLQEATSGQFNSDIRNSVNFLANVPCFRAQATTTPASIPSGTTSQVTGLAATIDNWGAFTASSGTWTCPLSGLYLVGGASAFPQRGSAYATYTSLHATQSGVGNSYTGSNAYGVWPASMALRTLRFTAGDTLQLWANQSSGSALMPNGNGNARLFTLWLSS